MSENIDHRRNKRQGGENRWAAVIVVAVLISWFSSSTLREDDGADEGNCMVHTKIQMKQQQQQTAKENNYATNKCMIDLIAINTACVIWADQLIWRTYTKQPNHASLTQYI